MNIHPTDARIRQTERQIRVLAWIAFASSAAAVVLAVVIWVVLPWVVS